MQKDRFVQVVRYARNVDFWNEYSNLGGAAVVFDIDYEKKEVKARWSACSEDINFSKKEGTARAKSRDTMVVFDLELKNQAAGLMPALIATILHLEEDFVSLEDAIRGVKYYIHTDEYYPILRHALREFEARNKA